MTDPQTAADAAERVQAADEDYIARAIAMLREWFVIAEPSGDEDAIIDVPAAVIDAAVAALEQAADDRARMAAELEQVRRGVTIPVLRQAWRNGWSDRARAVRDAVRASDNERDAYERAFARYMSEDPAEADKDPYRPLDGPDDPAAMPTRPAGGFTGVGQGPALPTPAQGPQRPAQGDDVLCLAGIPADVAKRIGQDPDTLCALPLGHADPTHDDGNGLSWQGPPVPPGTPGMCSARLHPDFADGEDIRCQLPAGHAAHRNGTREWMP